MVRPLIEGEKVREESQGGWEGSLAQVWSWLFFGRGKKRI